MATAQAAFRAHASTPSPATEVVGRLNDAVYEQSDADKFFTLFYAELEPRSGRLLYINAGHNPPLLLRSDERPAEQLRTGGLILGFRPGIDFASRDLLLEPGDLIAIFSDGITEAPAPDGEEFGEARLVDILREQRHRPVEEIWDQVHRAVLRFTENAPAFDDLTLTLVRRD